MGALCETILYISFVIFISTSTSSQDQIYIKGNNIVIKQDGPANKEPFVQFVDISAFGGNPQNCSSATTYCVIWSDKTQFTVTKKDACNNFSYETNTTSPLSATFNISGLYVYGGPEQNYATYPMNISGYVNTPYVSSEINSQAVLESYWLLSDGTYIRVNDEVPLFITFDKSNGTFQITAKKEAPYIRGKTTLLKYTICRLQNMKLAQQKAITQVFKQPSNEPDELMVQFPIWSTWAKFKTNISQQIVLDYAKQISDNHFKASQMEIDDKWEKCYGSFEVNTTRFPNVKKMIQTLKSMKFRVTFWVHPFINEDCEPYYTNAKNAGYFVKTENGSIQTKWWNGNASIIDFTNKHAVNWWKTRLRNLKKDSEINAFKFDAGESSYNPQVPLFNVTTDDHPESSLERYVRTASSFGKMVEVRVGRGTSKYQLYVRMLDLNSEWGGVRGLSSLIPILLQFNTIGYSFVLPDYVGGNAYGDNKPDGELFIRWLQANTFMPVIQLSIAPWEFNNTIVDLAHKFLKLHNRYAKNIESAMKEYIKTGAPVNRPLWWVDPEDPVTYTIDTEFLLGDDILVAPVLEKGATSRDIYIPKGTWQEEGNKKRIVLTGPTWLKNYSAGLDVLPYFTKYSGNTSSATSALLSFSTFFLVTFAVPIFLIILDCTVTL